MSSATTMMPTSRAGGVSTPLRLPKAAEPELEPDMGDAETMPGTPPFTPAAAKAWAAADNNNNNRSHNATATAATTDRFFADESPERMAQRHTAAAVVQRASRSFLARKSLAHRLSAVGRPVELRVTQVQGLEMLCDYRDVNAIYCNVRVLKRPFGPFMFQFSTSKSANVHLPTWSDAFFVPMLSSRCDLVVTLIGVTVTNRQRFLGQAIAQLEPGWERATQLAAPLGKWKFPVEASLVGLHRFVTGTVRLELAPVSSRLSCKAGQFLMAPPISSARASSGSGAFSFWTRKVTISTPSPQTPNNPLSASPARKSVVTRWGVLTDTAFHLFDHSSAKLLLTLDLGKIQLIQSPRAAADARKSDPNRLFPVKIYALGTLYTLYVSTYAQQQAWEYKIDLHRRQLLIP